VVGTTVSVALRNVVMGIGGVIYLFALAPKLAALLLLGIPVVILPIVFLGRRLEKLSRSSQDRIADVGAMVDEVLGAMKIVQSFNQQGREASRFEAAVESVFGTARRRILLRAFMTALVIGLIFGAITLIMWQGALDVQAGRLSGGTIAAFVLTGGLVAGSFGALTEVYGDLLRGAGAAGRLAELLSAQPEIKVPAQPKPLPLPARGELRFENVNFRYPRAPKSPRSPTSPLPFAPARHWRWSARRARANRHCSSWRSASTIRRAAPSVSTALPFRMPIPPISGSGSRWCRRRP
jgi:ATP-binding cassette subfamily B protein